MIKVKLNDMNYRYDVFQMINLFFNLSTIDFIDNDNDDYDYKFDIDENKIIITTKDDRAEYIFDSKFTRKEEIKKAIFIFFSNLTGKILPWGTLIGIRPSKIAMKMIKQGSSENEIIKYFKDVYLTSSEKAQLCIDIAKSEEKFVKDDDNLVSVYIGMPFCPTRCLYCSFASNPISKCKKLVEPYLDALKTEIIKISEYINANRLGIECVYFGGGTPTAVNDEEFRSIMDAIEEYLILNRNIKEFTVECGRPDSITEDKLRTMKEKNVHRISINPQTMNEETLKLIGRNHTVEQVKEKFNLARSMGFTNINMDIIVGLPGEKLSHINNTCNQIKELKPESVTVHGLSVKRASKLYDNIINNYKYEIPEQEELNAMYSRTVALARDLNMAPYYMYRQKNMIGNMDNVGYCLENKECIYNIEMIEDKQNIIALGADAVSKIVFKDTGRIERFGNVKDVKEYVERIDEMIDKKLKLMNLYY